MPTIIRNEFNKYKVQYYTDVNATALIAIISCKMNSTYIGTMRFYKNGSTLPVNQESGNAVVLHYYEKSIPDILNILQNEKPLYLNLNTITNIGWLQTLDEVVGEEES